MRILFPKNKQRKFIEKILSKISVFEAAKLCGLSERTIRDWRREKFLISQDAAYKLCKKTGVNFPSKFKLKDDYWYAYKGAKIGSKIGAAVCIKKYGNIGGDPEYRKRKWYEWWEREGKHREREIFHSKEIRRPRYSKKLAEFVGIILGDGSIMERQVIVTLHKYDDKEYSHFVVNMFKSLFNVPVSITWKKHQGFKAIDCVVSRKRLVEYCVDTLGLKIGNKTRQQVDVPDWVKNKLSYKISCVRGLIDTDGSLFLHKYKVNGKEYKYKKIEFSNSSKPLVRYVNSVFREVGINSRIARQEKEVRIDSISDVKKYFCVIGSHNPKHLKKYKN